ncbi:MAG: hypothetical protein HY289_03985 [Planctomycetes bacterium]|nr:hypothetical protein [Planctomycetota bacterium]
MQRAMRTCGVVLFVCLLFSISGCSYAYSFALSLVVKGIDGAPLQDVNVTLKAEHFSEAPNFPVSTGPDGSVRFSFRVRDTVLHHDAMPKWSLLLSKQGFHDEEIDITLKQKPESPKRETQLVVAAFMRPK